MMFSLIKFVVFACTIYSNKDTSDSPQPLMDAVHRQLTFLFYRLGSRGGITQVKVIFLNQSARTLVRNVKGPVRKGDVLALLESEREARRLR